MAKLVIQTPSNAEQLFKFQEMTIPGNQVVLAMDNASRFAVFGLHIQARMVSEMQTLRVEIVTQPGTERWQTYFVWDKNNALDFPFSIVDEKDPLACYKIRLTYTPIVSTGKFPGIGVDYSEATIMFTDPPLTDEYTVGFNRLVRKRGTVIEEVVIPNNEVWFPLREGASKIYRVYYPFSTDLFIGPPSPTQAPFLELAFHDYRSRYTEHDPIPVGSYSYDPVMETVMVNADTFLQDLFWATDLSKEITLLCDYVVSGSKALVPVEAIDVGPMFDVDKGTIVRIHADDYAKLPQEDDDNPTEWQVINDTEMQGGYQYWNAEYLDLVAYQFDKERTGDGPGFNEGYRGSGVNFQKVGSAPDAFDKDIADYRQFWLGPNGEFVKGLWQTKARGYVTFIGPPNKMIPAGVRVYAPAQVKYETNTIKDDAEGLAESLAPRIPNGGMLPAPLVLKLNVSSATQFPNDQEFHRKSAAFKPRILLYLRERVKYNGATHWKDVGEGYGTETEITGVPYWL